MIMKGISPTLRHVSRTHRAAHDWLFGRINLEPKIHIRYVDTKNPLADMPTKESSTRDECNHLPRPFDMRSFPTLPCSRFSNFLSVPFGKQSSCQREVKNRLPSEGSPMAKRKPIFPAKARLVNLVLRSAWSARENPPQDLGYPVNPGNVDEGQK